MTISNNEREYAHLNREIKMKYSQAKENYLNKKCLEMEQVYNVASKVAHQKICEITGKYKGHNGKYGCILDESSNIIMKTMEILERWVKVHQIVIQIPQKNKYSDFV